MYTVTDGTLGSDWNSICSGEVTLDNSVTRLNYVGFYSNASAITIPATTLSINIQPFFGPNLETITVSTTNPNYKSVDGVLYSKNGNTLILYPINKAGENFTVPSGVVEISSYAFGCLKNLKHLVLPNSVSNAAYMSNINGCGDNSLESYDVASENNYYSSVDGVLFNKSKSIQISYPVSKPDANYSMLNSVTEIRSQAFSNAKYLRSMTLSDHLQKIGTYSFSGLNLATLNLPPSLTTIDSLGLDSTKSVTLDSGNTSFSLLDGVLFNYSKSEIISYFNIDTRTSYTFPSTVTSSRNYVFGNYDGRNLTRLSINTSLLSAGVESLPIRYLNLGANFKSNGVLGNWYLQALLKVNYCGGDAPTISEINSRLAGWNNATLICVASAPAFSLSRNSEAATVGSAIQGYSISSSTAADSYAISPNPGSYGLTFNSATGLLSGTPNQIMSSIQFTIKGSNALGDSTALYTLSASPPPTVPSAPNVSAVSSGGSTFANVTITAPSSTGGSEIDHYTVTSNPGGFTATGWAPGVVKVYGLSPATSYTFNVTATNGVGTSPASAASSSMTTNASGVYSVGDRGPGGGIIFYIASAGFSCDNSRNYCNILEMAPTDVGGGDVAWCSDTTHSVGTTGESIGLGGANTRAMMTSSGAHSACASGAGYLADSYVSSNGTSDWYLPSMNELQMMYYKFLSNGGELSTMGQFSDAPRYGNAYWSSTELAGSSTYARVKNFGNWFDGNPEYALPKATVGSGVGRVRPIRAFTNAPAASLPSAPTSVVARPTGYNSASVTFTPSTSDGYSLISEYIAVSTPGNISASISASEVGPIAVSGLTPGTSYTFKVKARNSVGVTESAASTAISTNSYGVYHVGDIGPSGGYIFFVTDTPFACASGSCNYVEAAPVDLTPGTWESATATALAYRGGGRSDWYLPSSEMQQYMYDNLAYVGLGSFPCANSYGDGCRGVEYWSSTESGTAQAFFKRFGVSGGWWYSSTDAKSVVREVRPVRAVATPTVAGPPTIGATSRVGVLSANVAFTPPSSDGGRTITSYKVTSSPGGITATSSSAINNVIRIDGLSPSTAYRFTVLAINEAGESTSSAQSSVYTTPNVPAISAPIRGAGSVLFNVTGWSSAFDVAVTLGSNSPGKISVDTSTASTYAVTISDLFADEVVTPSFVVSAAGTNEIVRSANFTTGAAAGAVSFSKTLSVPSPDLQNGLIALSSDGTYMLVTDSAQAGLIYLSTNGGKSWSPQYSMGRAAWGRPAMSSTGQYMAVSATGTKIWVSNNYGATWAERDEARAWKSVSISADGHTILATTDGLNNIFSSANYGGTWETITATASNWRYAVPSGDGSKIAVCMNSDGLYLSTNSGASATRMKSFAAYSVNENSCAGVGMSNNGTTIVVLLGSYGHMLISTNSGSTWTEVTRFAGIGLSNLSVSSDGTRISAVDASSGYLYVSTDSGRSWQKITDRVMNSSAFTSAGTLVALPKSVNILQGKSLTGVCTNDTTSLSTSNRINDGDSSSLFRCYTNTTHSTARYIPQSAGFVTPDVGSWIVTGISFVPGTSSNLDPTKFSLFGCTSTSSSSCKILVANGSTGLGTNTTLVKIRNSAPYNFYRVLFESIRGANIPNYGNALELAEVSLFGAPAPISSSESLGSGSSSSGSITQLGIIPLVGPVASNTTGYAFAILNFDRSYSWNVVPTGGESASLNTSTGLVTVTGLASQTLGTVMITASKQGYTSSDPLFVSGTAIAAIETTVVQGSQSLVTIALSPAGSASSFDVSVGLPYSTPAGAKILAEGAMTDRVDRGLGTVRLSLRDSNNAPIETLADAVSITIPTSQGAVPVYSPTGTSWVAIPELIPAYVGAVPLLPAGQMMGYYINANGDTVILTRKI